MDIIHGSKTNTKCSQWSVVNAYNYLQISMLQLNSSLLSFLPIPSLLAYHSITYYYMLD
jgi:hypothetical protein